MSQMRQRWEYALRGWNVPVSTYPDGPMLFGTNFLEAEAEINQLAAEGWELMETQIIGQLAAQTPTLLAVFRRRVEGALEEEGRVEHERWLITASEVLARAASRPYSEAKDYELEDEIGEETQSPSPGNGSSEPEE